jgi:hypothetical protein
MRGEGLVRLMGCSVMTDGAGLIRNTGGKCARADMAHRALLTQNGVRGRQWPGAVDRIIVPGEGHPEPQQTYCDRRDCQDPAPALKRKSPKKVFPVDSPRSRLSTTFPPCHEVSTAAPLRRERRPEQAERPRGAHVPEAIRAARGECASDAPADVVLRRYFRGL